MSDSHRSRLTDLMRARGAARLIAIAPERRRYFLWSTMFLLGIPAGVLGFLSILFWVYGVEP